MTSEKRQEWREWIKDGAPANKVPANVVLNMLCQKCGQIMRCLPDECAPKKGVRP